MESPSTLGTVKSEQNAFPDTPRQRPKLLYAPTNDPDPDFSTRKHKRKWLGLDYKRPFKAHEQGAEYLWWPQVRTIFQEPFSEFLGTMILTLMYEGSLAQATLGVGIQTAPGGAGYGSYASVPWGLGIGVMMGIYIAGDSGAYLNPAITFANCMFRGLPWRQFPITVFAQFLGAFVGAGIIYANYIPAIDNFSGHGVRAVSPTPQATASLFATYPQPFVNPASQVFSIIIPSAIIAIVISALKDDYNNGVSKAGGNFFPLLAFFLFYGIAVAFGFETGGATNPALDFAGRLMSNIVGYPREVWSSSNYYFWMPIILPFIGTAFGGFLYDIFVYTGPSPINSPWIGFEALAKPAMLRRNKARREAHREDPHSDAI